MAKKPQDEPKTAGLIKNPDLSDPVVAHMEATRHIVGVVDSLSVLTDQQILPEFKSLVDFIERTAAGRVEQVSRLVARYMGGDEE